MPKSPNSIPLSGSLLRRTLHTATIAGALTLGLGPAPSCERENLSKIETNSRSQLMDVLKNKITKVTLGNVTFQLENPEALSEEETYQLFKNFEQAYGKLVDYFGPELVSMDEPMTLPIRINPNLQYQGLIYRDVQGNISDMDRNIDLLENFVFSDAEIIILKNLNERTIFHELFHLFFHGPGFCSTAFKEGHAHLIEELVYSASESDQKRDSIVSNPRISTILDMGLDYPDFHRNLNSGITDNDLSILAHGKWKAFWQKALEKDPNFLRKFYLRIKEHRHRVFPKRELLEIASEVSEPFQELYQEEGTCIRDIGETGYHLVTEAVAITDQNTIIVFNFRDSLATHFGDENTLNLAKLERAFPGNIDFELRGRSTEISIDQFRTIDIDSSLQLDPTLKIRIGDQKIPLSIY